MADKLSKFVRDHAIRLSNNETPFFKKKTGSNVGVFSLHEKK